MKYLSQDAEKRTVLAVAEKMITAARTAPKGCGIDHLETFILDGEDKDKLAQRMKELGKEWGLDFFIRDGNNVEQSIAIVFFGAREEFNGLSHCGYCGFENCGQMKKNGGKCSVVIGDLGIAIGSAVSIAADNRIDNRIMFSAGKAAIDLELFDAEVKVAYVVPLFVSSKSPFFDRGLPNAALQQSQNCKAK